MTNNKYFKLEKKDIDFLKNEKLKKERKKETIKTIKKYANWHILCLI